MEHNHCKQCEFEIEHNYCPKCGQTKHVPKIDKNFILYDLKHGIFHFDNSFIFTLFSLFKEPTVVIKKYIQGNRKQYANPFSLVAFLATLYTFISSQVIKKNNIISGIKNNNFSNNETIHNHIWLILLILPILSFLTYSFFKKSGYGYFEIIVCECFIQSKIVIINFLFLPLNCFFPDNPFLNIVSFLFTGIFAIRAKVLFFTEYSFFQVLVRVLLTTFVCSIILMFIMYILSAYL